MNRIVCAVMVLGFLLITAGCANTATVASRSTEVGVYFGDRGIWGHDNNLTVQSGSRLMKLSICGNDNTVTIERDVTLPHIEFFGNNNTVSIPETLIVRVTKMGQGNSVIRRPGTYDYATEADTFYLPSEEELPAYTEPATVAPPPAKELPAGEPAEEPAEQPPTEGPGSADEDFDADA